MLTRFVNLRDKFTMQGKVIEMDVTHPFDNNCSTREVSLESQIMANKL